MKISTLIKIINFIKTLLPSKLQDYILKKLKKETYLSQVEFHLVDNCNLNCAYCDHFSPLAEEKFHSIDSILDDFKKLKKIFDNIGKIYILGGEPLLHPDILEIFAPIRKIYPKSKIAIITNGILLNKQNDTFWKQLKENNITLSMTHYPINVDYEKYIEKCNSMGIKVCYFGLDRNKMQNMNLDIKGKRNKTKAFMQCTRKKCHFLSNGKLYLCTLVPNVKFLNKYFNLNFKVQKSDYIDLNKIKSASKINKIFSKPIDFCAYCNDEKVKFCSYHVSKREKSEWVKE